jgi:hypothetical protein
MANSKEQIAHALPNGFANGWVNQMTHGKWHTVDRREMPEGLEVDMQIDFRMDSGMNSRAKWRIKDDRSKIASQMDSRICFHCGVWPQNAVHGIHP